MFLPFWMTTQAFIEYDEPWNWAQLRDICERGKERLEETREWALCRVGLWDFHSFQFGVQEKSGWEKPLLENLNLSVRGIGWIKKINLIQCIQLPSCIQSPLHLPLCHHRSPPNHHGLFCLNRPLPFIRMICQPWIPWWSIEVPATHAICVSFSARASTLTTACLPAIQVNPWPTKQHQPDPLLRFTC